MSLLKSLFTINSNGDQRAGVLILPDDYASNPNLCPLIVFSHGVGEAATSVSTSLIGDPTSGTGLFANGSPAYLAANGGLSIITCPITGLIYRPAVFALQGINGWCVEAADIVYAIQLLLKAYTKLDPAAIMATGLSAGGEVTWEMAAGPNGALFVAAVPMSTAAVDTTIINWSNTKAKCWAFHGTIDGGDTAYQNSITCVNAVNAVYPGDAFLTSIQGGGHGPWAPNYAVNNRVAFSYAWTTGMPAFGKSIDIYEFLLACKNSNFKFTTSGTSAGINPTPVSTTPTKAVAKVTINSDLTATLDPTGSTGSIASWWWSFVGPAGAGHPWSSDGRLDGGAALTIKTLQGLTVGSWTFQLSVQDKTGSIATSTVTQNVGGASSGPTVVQVFTANGITYTLLSDNTWK